MPRVRECAPVDADYALTGPNQVTLVQPIAKPAEAVFRSLEHGPAWKEWLGIEVEWTSSKPFGIGTTRTVANGPITIDEYFLAWDDGERMTFRFDRSTLPVTAFAEDYHVVATSPSSCEMHWSYAYDWDGPLAVVSGKAFAAFFAFNGKRSLRKLASYLDGTSQFD